jgi:hypothetical protein
MRGELRISLVTNPKRGDARASQENHAAEVAKKCRRRFSERRSGMVREIGTERSLRDELDHQVDDRRNHQREISRPGNGTRRIFHFATWNQRHLDAPRKRKSKG